MSKTLKRCDKRMAKLDEQAARLESEDGSFLVDAAYLLELAKRAANLYKSSRNESKNKLLKTIFSNLKSANKKVDFSLLKGIDLFFYTSKMEIWLPKLDDFRIACYEYDRLYGRALAEFVSKNLQTMV